MPGAANRRDVGETDNSLGISSEATVDAHILLGNRPGRSTAASIVVQFTKRLRVFPHKAGMSLRTKLKSCYNKSR